MDSTDSIDVDDRVICCETGCTFVVEVVIPVKQTGGNPPYAHVEKQFLSEIVRNHDVVVFR